MHSPGRVYRGRRVQEDDVILAGPGEADSRSILSRARVYGLAVFKGKSGEERKKV
jgi:hypothetical protein